MMINPNKPTLYGKVKKITEKVYVVGQHKLASEYDVYKQIPEITKVSRFLHDGRMESVEFYGLNEFEHKWIYRYNDEGKPVKVFQENATGEIFVHAFYKYSQKGLLNEYVFFCEPEFMVARSRYSYNRQSQLSSKTISERGDPNASSTTRYEYFPETNKRVLLNSDTENTFTGKEIETYDTSGNLVGSIEFGSKGERIRKTRYEYDEQRNMTIQDIVYFDTSKTIVKHKYLYHYDSHNNWVKNFHYINDEFKSSSVREIICYS